MPYLFIRLYFFKCDVCVLNYIWINRKRFLILLYVFGSNFYHSLCSCLVLTLLFIVYTRSVLKNRCQSFSQLSWQLSSCETPVASSSRNFGDSLMTRKNFRDSSSHETPRNSFLKGFLWETCFKSFLSSLKLLFHYFYIKTQSI